MSKRGMAAALLARSGLLGPLTATRRDRLVVLCYHRIRRNGQAAGSDFDDGLFGPTQDDFDQQVQWLTRHTELLSEQDLLDVLKAPRSAGRRCSMITFDDGYRDNYDLAYPVLRAHGAPAIFFCCPALTDRRELGWWEQFAYYIKRCRKPSITVLGHELQLHDRQQALDTLTSWMKLRPRSETAALVQEVAAASAVAPLDHERQSAELMTWEQIREVSQNGIAIGSHTYAHPVLATIDEAAQRFELSESKRRLEEQLRRPVRTIAYPVGQYAHFTPVTMRVARECGYEAAFSAHTGDNLIPRINPFNIHRIAPTDTLDPLFQCSIAAPDTFSWRHVEPPAFARGAAMDRHGH